MSKTEYFEVESNKKTLRGMKHLSEKNDAFAVLIIHGYFSSNKIGPHRLYVNIANQLSERFCSCYRFDMSGMGESDGDISNIKFNDHVYDIMNIINYLKNNGKKEIIVISHCLGCNLLIETILRYKYVFREIIFMTPYFTNKEILRLFFPKDDQIIELFRSGHTYRNGLYVDSSYFLEQTDYDRFLHSVNSINTYINIIAAKYDQFIPFEYNENLRVESNNINFTYIESDHNFLTKQSELIDKIEEIINDDYFTNTKV